MVLKSLSDLKNIVAGGPRKKLIVAAAQDQHSLGAVIRAWKDNVVEPILIGDKESIQNICSANNYDISGLRIIHEPDMEMAVEMSVRMVNNKQADVLMKGKLVLPPFSSMYSIRSGDCVQATSSLILPFSRLKHITR